MCHFSSLPIAGKIPTPLSRPKVVFAEWETQACLVTRAVSKAAGVGTMALLNVLLLSSICYAQAFWTVCGRCDKAALCGQEEPFLMLLSQEWSWRYTLEILSYFPSAMTTSKLLLKLSWYGFWTGGRLKSMSVCVQSRASRAAFAAVRGLQSREQM